MSKPSITVVTGGSSGIGAACVRHLAKRGDKVVSLDLPGTWSDEKMKAIGVHAYACNVTDDDGMHKVAAMIEATHGPVTALVNCAGILQHRLPPDRLTMTEWDRVVDIDLRGTYLACAIYGSRMVELGGGAIVNIASITSLRSSPLHSVGFLLSPAAKAITGINLPVDAGWLAGSTWQTYGGVPPARPIQKERGQ